jgi:hypothetical protein
MGLAAVTWLYFVADRGKCGSRVQWVLPALAPESPGPTNGGDCTTGQRRYGSHSRMGPRDGLRHAHVARQTS